MSHGITPFAVSLSQLRKVVGSRSKSALRELREEFEDELLEDREEVEETNSDDEFDPELCLEDALRHLVMDEERWDYEGAKYGLAIEMLCSFYGEILPNEHWSSKPLSWAETVSDAFTETCSTNENFSLLGYLIYRGSPVIIPEIEDFPYIGYVALPEIPEILDSLTDQRFQQIKHEDAESIRVSLKQVRDWFETCLRDKSDLVCFCY